MSERVIDAYLLKSEESLAGAASEYANRRKRYPAALRETLIRGMRLRQIADYKTERVSDVQASRGLIRTREFLDAVVAEGAKHR